jgi:uncharacterized protein YxjI
MAKGDTFEQYNPDDIICPNCRIRVLDDPVSHKLVSNDRLDCKVCKTIFRIANQEEIQLTNDQIINQILSTQRTLKKLEQPINQLFARMKIQENNTKFLEDRRKEMLKEILKLKIIIKNLGGNGNILGSTSENESTR